MPAIDYSKLLWTPFGNSPTNTFDRNNTPLPGLTSRSVQTLRVDQNGNPIIPAAPGAIPAPNAADARSEQNLTRQNMWFTSSAPGGPSPAPQTAQRSMVSNNWGTSVGRTFDPIWANNSPDTIMTAAAMPAIPGPNGYSDPNKSQDRLGAGTGLAFAGDEGQQNPALGAIGQVAGMPPMPRARPPLPPMPFQQSPMVRGGGAPQANSTPGSYTVKSGDTLSEISRRTGVSMATIMRLNPQITDPNKIIAGRGLVIGGVTGNSPQRSAAPLPKVPAPRRNNQSPKPAGYGSKGYSEAGRALQALYGN